MREFIPKSFLYLTRGYSGKAFGKDLFAGITVGIIALPLCMAFAIASGVGPERGIYTAIVAGFCVSAFGGSRVQIGGPTGAFVVLIFDIVARNGYGGLAVCTLIAAVILIGMGVAKLGSWIKYVPHPLVVGFTSGIALLIFSGQIKDFFGLQMEEVPAEFVEKWIAYIRAFSTLHAPTLILSSATLALILFIRRFVPRVPWGIAAIVLATGASILFELPVETIQSRYGDLPSFLPIPSFPSLEIPAGKLQEYLFDGLAIAFLGGLESLLSAVIADGMIGGRHKSNCELVGQGIANFASVVFGGIPATGAIARTASNVKTGAQTPMAGMIHAFVLLAILFFLSPVVSQIPLASLAAILIMVSWTMSEAHYFVRLFRAPLGDIAILLTAFLLTVFVDITFAIAIGMVLASLLFMKRMGDSAEMRHLFHEDGSDFPEQSDPDAIEKRQVPPGVEVYEISGPFFFGAADLLQDLIVKQPKIYILRMRKVSLIDASGMHALKEFYLHCQKVGAKLLLSGIHKATAKDLQKFGLYDQIGKESIFPHIDAALAKAEQLTGTRTV